MLLFDQEKLRIKAASNWFTIFLHKWERNCLRLPKDTSPVSVYAANEANNRIEIYQKIFMGEVVNSIYTTKLCIEVD